MQLSIDLTGREVLVTGSDTAARQAVRRYEAAGAVVSRLSTPQGRRTTVPCRSVPSWWPRSTTASRAGSPCWSAAAEPASRSPPSPPPDPPARSPWWAAGRAPPNCSPWRPSRPCATPTSSSTTGSPRTRSCPSLSTRRTGRCGQAARPPPGQPGRDRGAHGRQRPSPAGTWCGSRAATRTCSAAAAKKWPPASRPACPSASSPASPVPSPSRRPPASRSPTARSATCSPWSPATPR